MARTSVASKAKVFTDLPEDYRECIDDYIMHGVKTRAFELIKSTDGMSPNVKKVSSQKFFNKPNILAIIDERKAQLASVGSMEKQDILRHIENIAKGIQEDQFSDKTSVKDQLSALQLLCKINGIIDDKPTTNVTVQQVFVDDIKE